MPIYEYQCGGCQNIFEEWTRHVDDNTRQKCPKCGGEARRIVSNTSFVLKGGGWYVTDYGYRKGKGEDGDAAAPAGSASQTSQAGQAGQPGASAAEAAPKTASPKGTESAASGKPAAAQAASPAAGAGA